MKQFLGGSRTDAVSQREKENDVIAYRAALESIVLLRNDGCLPLQNRQIALFGVGASHTIKGGTGSGEVNNRHSVSIYEGMKKAGFTVSSERWIEEYIAFEAQAHAEWIKENRAFPSAALLSKVFRSPAGRPVTEKDFDGSDLETALYVISRHAGEGADLRLENGDFNLNETELQDIRLLYASFRHLIVVINTGSVMDLSELDGLDISLIYMCFAGQQGGAALAALLKGEEAFSAKLTDTWMKRYADVPCGEEFSVRNGTKGNEYYREGIFMGYRYYDACGIAPRFPFGFGLTYSSFSLCAGTIRRERNNIIVPVEVTNTGNFKGKEVVQIYVSCPQGRLTKEVKRLVSFGKTKELQPGQADLLRLSFDLYGLASYDEAGGAYILEQGEYVIRVGSASDHTAPVAVIEVTEEITVSKHAHLFADYEKFKELFVPSLSPGAIPKDLPRVIVNAGEIETVTYRYGKKEPYSDPKVDAVLRQMSNMDMIDVVVGTGSLGMIDSTVFYAPGCAGKTTAQHREKGLPPAVLADGPAGLRLVRKTAVSEKGRFKMYPGNYLVSFMEVMPPIMGRFFAPGKKDTTLYFFATAFPVCACLAQSWNVNLVEEVGCAVSREMDEFNVTFWLAPGMNLHRNPLCGRNFEYYSEDPVLSGKISAAMTRGVQSIKGNYTVIKHFCCNNASEDSNKSNSHVSERALRELYLKGFEINVREAGSGAVMTAYNMINGVYAPDSFDLCTKVLRNEWGFDGVVMTDWSATDPNGGVGHSELAIANGNDMIMPGGKSYKKAIAAGLKSGIVSRDDLRRAAANIIRSILYSNAAKKISREED